MNITLNLQGKIFETTHATIIKIPYFRDMFEACEFPSETLFVNRSSYIFKHVLALVTDSLYPFPEKFNFELDFYGVEYKKPICCTRRPLPQPGLTTIYDNCCIGRSQYTKK